MPQSKVAVMEGDDANGASVAAGVRVDKQVDAAPLADDEIAPHAEHHRRQIAARAFREVRRHRLRGDDAIPQQGRIGAEDKVTLDARALPRCRHQLRDGLSVCQKVVRIH